MVQPGSRLVVADNSGAKVIEVITVLGGAAKDKGTIGTVVSAAVKVALPHGNVKRKSVVKALVVRQKQNYQRKDGSVIRFGENAAVLIDPANKEPVGTRVFGPIPREIRDLGYQKIISLAPEVL